MNKDKRCYGGLIRDIENEHTLTGAYDYLVNCKEASRLSSNDQDEGGLAFYNEDTTRTTRVEDMVAAVEAAADEVVEADVDKVAGVVEAVMDAEKLLGALLVERTLPPKIPPLMARATMYSFC